MSEFGERLRTARAAAKRTQQEVADRFGIVRVSVSQWESGTTSPDTSRIGELASFLGVTSDWLLTGKGLGPMPGPDHIRRIPAAVPPPSTLGLPIRETIPVYAAAQGGSGHTIVTFEEIDRVKRPQALEHVKDGYGILVTGDSMVPAYEPGDVALIHPRLAPMANMDVVLYGDIPEGGEAEALIKRLLRTTATNWVLRQYNPPMDFEASREDWRVCHRVVGRYNSR